MFARSSSPFQFTRPSSSSSTSIQTFVVRQSVGHSSVSPSDCCRRRVITSLLGQVFRSVGRSSILLFPTCPRKSIQHSSSLPFLCISTDTHARTPNTVIMIDQQQRQPRPTNPSQVSNNGTCTRDTRIIRVDCGEYIPSSRTWNYTLESPRDTQSIAATIANKWPPRPLVSTPTTVRHQPSVPVLSHICTCLGCPPRIANPRHRAVTSLPRNVLGP